MKCHFCNSVPQFKEESTNLAFCDKFCQVGHHLINGRNPLELNDTLFQILLQVPPSRLFDLIGVSDQFRQIIRETDSFKREYVKKWTISDEFYFFAYYVYPEWLPFVRESYGFGFLAVRTIEPNFQMWSLLKSCLKHSKFEVAKLVLKHFDIGYDDITTIMKKFVNRIDVLSFLLQYIEPDELEIFLYWGFKAAIKKRADINVIKLILASSSMIDVSKAKKKLRDDLERADIYALLLKYEEEKTSRSRQQ